MITLVGIGHVFSIRKAVKYIVYRRRPHAVCVELDKMRFDALDQKLDRSDGAPFLMKRLQKVYDKAATMQGAEVGEEMLGAVEAAKRIGIPHFFIDVEATPMVSSFLSGMTMGQKLKLAGSVLGASILPKKHLEKGLDQIEKDPEKAMEQFGKVFPELKEKLVDYRDRYMAGKILSLNRRYPHVLAVVGQGHVGGMAPLLEKAGLEIINLNQVQSIARKLEDGELKLLEPDELSGNNRFTLTLEMGT